MIAEVDVDRASGKIRARKFTVAHDCGQIINPHTLTQTIEGNVIHGTSRTLWEEVEFDRKNVTSVDWATYPILDITDAPEKVDVVLINHPDIPFLRRRRARASRWRPRSPTPSSMPPGCKLRRVPFSPDKMKAAFS